MTFRDVICKKISILGMARSGLAVAELLKRHGAKLFVSDVKGEAELNAAVSQLRKLGVEFETGGHTEKVIQDRDLVVLSPGVPPNLPILREAQKRGLLIVSEVEVAGWFSEAHLVGITGSNGKTTTVSLVGEIVKNAGREVSVCGNIGLPFSEVATSVSGDGYVVMELSSFQLEKVEKLRLEVAAILNISPDHLDRHSDMSSYRSAKLRILENQREADVAILNADDPALSSSGKRVSPAEGVVVNQGVRTLHFSTSREVSEGVFVKRGKIVIKIAEVEQSVISASEIGIKGPHNLANACAACCVASALGIEGEVLGESLRRFGGVEHRLEMVLERAGVKVVNDSKATNVEAVWYALQSVDAPVILLMGGRDKGGDFSRLKELVKKKVKSLILAGEASEKIKMVLGSLVPTKLVGSMEEAVRLAQEASSEGDTILLSPGGSSFDMFENYEHRGRVFKELCRKAFLPANNPSVVKGRC